MRRRTFLVAALAATAFAGRVRPQRWEWRGDALGAEARIVLLGDRDTARAAIAAAADEIERLERIFSLHRPESELSRLNRAGTLAAPSRDIAHVLSAAAAIRGATEGAFDPAVQPLWEGAAAGDARLPVERVRQAEVRVAGGRIDLSPGTRLTLNGIAQGTVADRVAELLVAHGFEAPVVDAGEMRLPGAQRRAIALPAAGLELDLADVAVATSEPGAMPLGPRHHLFDPATGLSPRHWKSVTVIAPDAQTADALSTAFAVSDRARIGDLVPPGIRVIATAPDGGVHHFGRRAG